jgi:hypothetical protein
MRRGGQSDLLSAAVPIRLADLLASARQTLTIRNVRFTSAPPTLRLADRSFCENSGDEADSTQVGIQAKVD